MCTRGALLVAAALIAACGGKPTTTVAGGKAAAPQRVSSNITRADYAGSDACADCHAQIYAAWRDSPMRNMTRSAATATIRAPFDGATLRVGADTATMEMDGATRIIRVATPSGTTRFRVTRVVGGRYREDFVGIADGSTVENVLPATYVFATKSWRYKGYSVMVKERPAMSARGVWSQECIGCHNTLPLATTLYDELYGPNLPGYQGKVSDRTMPADRLWTVRSRDDDGLAKMLVKEIEFLGAQPPETTALRELLPAAAKTSSQRLDGNHLVELGIGCEACHNGSREHVANERVRPSYEVASPLLAMTPPGPSPGGTRARWINHTCAKCHTVLFTRYPHTWEGGSRTKRPGGSTTNSGEGRDFELGACASQMACTSCHDPHAADAPDRLGKLATPAGNVVCAGCHAKIAANVAGHSHHAPNSAGTSCVACHMPKKNMGLDYSLVRYHRIGSPTDAARVTGDRPVECALCHTERSVEDLVATMEKWWGKRYDRAPLRALYGDLSAPALRTTLQRGKPHEQAVAIATLGQARDATAVRSIAPHLAHEYPLVRFYAHRALETITGQPIPIDVGGAAANVKAAADTWLKARP